MKTLLNASIDSFIIVASSSIILSKSFTLEMSTKFPPLAGSAFPTEDNISSLFGAKVLIGAVYFFFSSSVKSSFKSIRVFVSALGVPIS